MTTHARGAIFLMPEVRAVLDVGALHARAMRIDERSRVLAYRMTSQCASGSGQFLENVARYLGIALEDVGPLSCSASNPQVVSSICAVLAETDVINMVSRGISTPDILKGIHLSMAGRYLKLLRAIDVHGPVAITGGLSADTGLAQALREKAQEDGLDIEIRTHRNAIYAGALGAALWGAYRHRMLSKPAEDYSMTASHELAGKAASSHRRLREESAARLFAVCSKRARQRLRSTSRRRRRRSIPWLQCDVRSDESVQSAVQQFFQQHGRLDFVVHAAGISREAVVWKLAVEDWDRIQAVNLRGAFLVLRHAIPLMRQGGGGRIVLIGSINGSRGKFGTSAYSASKAGLLGLAKSVARETGRFGITVNVIEPGWVRTPLTEALPGRCSPGRRGGKPAGDPARCCRHLSGSPLFMRSGRQPNHRPDSARRCGPIPGRSVGGR